MATDADALDQEHLENPEIIDEEQDGEAEVSLEGEEPAEQGDDPNESAVIRDFRKREREKDKRIAEQDRRLRELEQGKSEQPAAPGAKPTLEEFGFDEDKHGEALDKWYADKHAYEEAQRTTTARAEQVERTRVEGYQAAKAAQPIAGIDDAEKRVFAQVDDLTRNALLHAKSPAVIAALDKYPERLAAISDLAKSDPAGMLMMIGELRGKAKVVNRSRTAPEPERIASGTASMSRAAGAAEKKLAAMEAAWEKTGGDRTEIQKFKRDNNLK